jgi:hypothetical protein
MTLNKKGEGKMEGRKENRREEGPNLVRKTKLEKKKTDLMYIRGAIKTNKDS